MYLLFYVVTFLNIFHIYVMYNHPPLFRTLFLVIFTGMIALADITEICSGKTSAVFLADLPDSNCFSVVSKHYTLNLQVNFFLK